MFLLFRVKAALGKDVSNTSIQGVRRNATAVTLTHSDQELA